MDRAQAYLHLWHRIKRSERKKVNFVHLKRLVIHIIYYLCIPKFWGNYNTQHILCGYFKLQNNLRK